jgi:hypothetical protein
MTLLVGLFFDYFMMLFQLIGFIELNGMTDVNHELVRTWKEMVVAFLKILS